MLRFTLIVVGTFCATATAVASERVTVCVGNPDALLGAARPNAVLNELERLQTAPLARLPLELRQVASSHRALPGVKELDAVITREHLAEGGGDTLTNTYSIHGQVRHDGSFAVTSTMPSSCEGVATLAVEELAYDGASFFVGTPGNPTYTAYSATSTSIASALATQASFLDPVRAWVYSPFSITLFPGTQYAITTVGEGDGALVRVTETYPGMISGPILAGRTVYTLRVTSAGTHPVAIEHLDSLGNVQARREYDGYRELAPGVWRPTKIVARSFRAGAERPFLVETLLVRAARVMTREETAVMLPRPRSAENRWRVHHGT